MLQFSCRFAFLSTFLLSNRTPKITRILTLFSEGDKILIKNLYECKSYNAWQFITKLLNKCWTKNSINRLLVKFGTVDRRPRQGRGRRSARMDDNVDTVESLLQSQEDKTSEQPNSQSNFTWGVDPSISVSWIRSASQVLHCCKKRLAQQLTEVHSMHALCSACSLRDDSVITSKPTWKLKHAKPRFALKPHPSKLYSRDFWIFLPNIIKIDPYNFELYRFKVGPFFLRHSV